MVAGLIKSICGLLYVEALFHDRGGWLGGGLNEGLTDLNGFGVNG